jgi:hypothetical protein
LFDVDAGGFAVSGAACEGPGDVRGAFGVGRVGFAEGGCAFGGVAG